MKRKEEHIDLDLLVHKHLTNQATEAEKSQLNRLVGEDVEAKSSAKIVEQIWDTSAELHPDTEQFNSDKAFSKFLEEVNHSNTTVNEKSGSIISLRRIMSYAAILVIFMAATFLLVNNGPDFESQDQMLSVSLIDGSAAKLAPHSSITIHDDRHITFEGKAYFTIEKDPSHPFKIEVGDNDIIVLGTSFILESKENNSTIHLETGYVEINPQTGNTIHLEPGESATINSQGIKVNPTPEGNTYSLKSGVLSFNQSDLLKVAKDFERHYNVSLNFDPNAGKLENCSITAPSISAKSANNAAKLIAASLGGESTQLENGKLSISNFSCE